MKLFGDKLPVISALELIEYASRSRTRIRLELCDCRELGKMVVRVVAFSRRGREERGLGILVDADSQDYFVAARSAGGIRSKIDRLLKPILERIDIVQLENGVLRLFQGGVVAEIGASIMQ